ncbi:MULTISPECIES: hypothetical protein [Vibrionaceae]|uniref:hypothetical protein n=1 Tax=Vibrionaceae TaxID=641 RepID=UPI000348F47A|nr:MULTISPECIES: hypothetical protein [Vibrionaceae]ETZ12212.1 hypothetical protein AJ90_24630 [Vibrio parahaemolyticus M0605]EWS67216.1 hypothetical protein Y702_22105 [Vibrio vulnificus BAA87]EGQ8277219.1 hypothetical protein [Vibrio parahaemolyticus]EGR2993431.1 hypothetical protein [Vibrio parahaemolyticus]EGR3244956.1 hypothetical protein [Vibrio parahaemolyticus]
MSSEVKVSISTALQLLTMIALVIGSYFLTDNKTNLNALAIAQAKTELQLKIDQVENNRKNDMQRYIDSNERLSLQLEKLTDRLDKYLTDATTREGA